MRDSRLLGTWRSDARKTALEIAVRRDISAAQKKELRKLFGKLELRYTPTLCYSFLNGTVSVNRYVVVAKDTSSVVLVVLNPTVGRYIVHIHFEGPRYWIILGSGRMREFFKRVTSKAARSGNKTR